MGGYLFRISEKLKLKPSALLVYSLPAPLAYQANLTAIILEDMIWVSGGYKPGALVFIGEVQVGPAWRFGASLEWPVGSLNSFVGQSFELMLRRDLTWEVRDVSPAYFY
jgi:hypothetical protein